MQNDLLNEVRADTEGWKPVLELLIQDAPLETLLAALLQRACGSPDGPTHGAIFLLDPQGMRLKARASLGLPQAYLRHVEQLSVHADRTPCASAVIGARTVIVPDLAATDRWKEYGELASSFNIRSCWCVQLPAFDGESPGVLVLYHDKVHEPAAHQMEEANYCARIASMLVRRERSRALTPVQGASEPLWQLAAISQWRHRLYESFLQTTPDLAYVFDLDHRFIYANEALLRLWGKSWEESIGKTCLELGYEPWHAAMHDRELEQVKDTKQPIRGEVPFDGTNGRRFYDYIFVPVLGPDGEVQAIAGTTRDVTERRLTEDALRKSRAHLYAVYEQTSIGICETDLQGRIKNVNGRYCELVQRSREELLTLHMQDITHPDDLPSNMLLFRELVRSGKPYTLQKRYMQPGGQAVWAHIAVSLIQSDPGSPPDTVLAVAQDVTDLKNTEQALRTEKLRAENALVIAELGTFEWNMRSDAVLASERTREIFGFSKDEGGAGEDYFNRIIPADRERVRAEVERSMERDGRLHTEYRIRLPNGRVRHISSVNAGQKNAEGEWERQVGVFSDITERKQIEQELHEASKRKDEFLAMLAHELRNPLAPISAAADLLSMSRLDDEQVRCTSAIIARQVRHMTSLVDDLLDVSRVTRGMVKLDRSMLDMKRIVGDAVEQVRPLIESRQHHLAVHMPPDPAFVIGDAKRLVQVLANLLNNAAKYTAEGGHVALSMTVLPESIQLSVVDDGIGMTPEMTERAFELFVQAERSSDRAQGGLGLGLALVKSLVELHGGQVAARSRGPGAGSEFRIELPRAGQQEAAPDAEGGRLPAAAKRRLRLLVVDDNADAAVMLGMYLEAAGHEVLIEHDPHAAIERARREHPDVCLLDIGLPGMDGNELARRLRHLPETASAVLIAVTGYGQEPDRRASSAAGFDFHFVKPVDAARLAGLLAHIASGEVG